MTVRRPCGLYHGRMSRPARTPVPVVIPLSERLRTVAKSVTAVETPQEMAGLTLRTASEALGATLGRVLVLSLIHI